MAARVIRHFKPALKTPCFQQGVGLNLSLTIPIGCDQVWDFASFLFLFYYIIGANIGVVVLQGS